MQWRLALYCKHLSQHVPPAVHGQMTWSGVAQLLKVKNPEGLQQECNKELRRARKIMDQMGQNDKTVDLMVNYTKYPLV